MKKYTNQEIQMIKDNPHWTPDIAAYYIYLKTGIKRSVKSYAIKQKQILGYIPKSEIYEH